MSKILLLLERRARGLGDRDATCSWRHRGAGREQARDKGEYRPKKILEISMWFLSLPRTPYFAALSGTVGIFSLQICKILKRERFPSSEREGHLSIFQNEKRRFRDIRRFIFSRPPPFPLPEHEQPRAWQLWRKT